MILRQFQTQAIQRLRTMGCDTPELDAAVLIQYGLGCSREQLWLRAEELLTELQQSALESLIARRAAHEPVAYITGEKDFWKNTFRVTPETLIPRPDTETLVEAALAHAEQYGTPRHILEIGVGTGCILLSLLQEWSEAIGIGVDISAGALAVARENGDRLGLHDRVQWLESDWDAALPPEQRFDLLVSNPPYIPSHDAASLPLSVARFEPASALFAARNGLASYHRIAAFGKARLNPGSACFVEVGDGQSAETVAIFIAQGWKWLGNRRDLRQTERVCGFLC